MNNGSVLLDGDKLYFSVACYYSYYNGESDSAGLVSADVVQLDLVNETYKRAKVASPAGQGAALNASSSPRVGNLVKKGENSIAGADFFNYYSNPAGHLFKVTFTSGTQNVTILQTYASSSSSIAGFVAGLARVYYSTTGYPASYGYYDLIKEASKSVASLPTGQRHCADPFSGLVAGFSGTTLYETAFATEDGYKRAYLPAGARAYAGMLCDAFGALLASGVKEYAVERSGCYDFSGYLTVIMQ